MPKIDQICFKAAELMKYFAIICNMRIYNNNLKVKNQSLYDLMDHPLGKRCLYNTAWGPQHLAAALERVMLDSIQCGASAAAAVKWLTKGLKCLWDHRVVNYNNQLIRQAFQQLERILAGRDPQEFWKAYSVGIRPLVSIQPHPMMEAHCMGDIPDSVHVAHTIGPMFSTMTDKNLETLLSAIDAIYTRMLAYAEDNGLEMIRVLPISSGVFAGQCEDLILARFASFWKKAAETRPELTIELYLFDPAQYDKVWEFVRCE